MFFKLWTDSKVFTQSSKVRLSTASGQILVFDGLGAPVWEAELPQSNPYQQSKWEAVELPRSSVTWKKAEILSTQATQAELELSGQPSPAPFPPECDEASRVSPVKEHGTFNQFHAFVPRGGNKHILL